MAKINDIIREMEALLDGADLSNTPQGRQLAESYAEICQALNSSLEECRIMFNMGASAEARRINMRSTPSLTDRWTILNFPRRDEWIQLCALYNWAMPPEFDTDVINALLNKNESDVEISIEELQNQWRRIIRDGSLFQKLILARKIYALSPNKSAYSNLVNVERPWINQLKNEADAALEEKRDEDLFEIYQELTSPELITQVSSEDLKKYRQTVDAYKKTLLQKEKEQLLSLIASCYAAMLMDELEEALASWAQLEKNPLFSVTKDEELQINDARNFFREQQSIINENERFESLQSELEFLLNEEQANPAEIDIIYHQLQMYDRPVKTVLEERYNDFCIRRELYLKRRHVRKCITWVCSILATAVLIFAGIYLVHHELELRRDSAKIREMINARHFDAALKYCNKISHERPMTAKRAAIVALRTEAENLLKESQAAENVFNETCEELTNNYLNEEKVLDPVIDELFQTLEEKSKLLPQDKSTAKDQLRLRYQDLRERAFLKNEAAFLKEVRGIQEKWTSLLNRIEDFSEIDFTNKCNELQSEGNKLANSFQSRVRETTLTEQKNNFDNYYRQSKERVRQLRELRKDIHQLYHPESLEIYADALEKINNQSQRIAGIFKQAANQFPREMAIYNTPQNYENRFRSAGVFQINPYFRDLKSAGNPPFYENISTREFQKKFKALRSETLEKEYRLYELKFIHKNTIYHLYFSDPAKDIRIEWNWEHSNIKAIDFCFTIAPNRSTTNAIFKVSAKKDKQAMDTDKLLKAVNLNLVPGQNFSQLPAELQMEQPQLLTKINSISYSAHYQELREILDSMGDKPRNIDITSAIAAVAESEKITNIYAKVHLIKKLYELLPTQNPLYQQYLSPLEKFIQEYSDSDEECRWMDPTATFKNQNTAEFRQKLDKLTLRERFGLVYVYELLLESACKRIPAAIGVMYLEQGVWRLHQFKHGMNVTEVFVHYSPDAQDSKDLYSFAFPVETFSMPVADNKLPKELKKVLYNGMLVFAAPEATSYSEDVTRICEEIKNVKYFLPEDPALITWPESWPLNCRKFN